MNNEFFNASNDNNIGYGNQPSTISADSEGHNTALENPDTFNNIAQDTEITGCPTPSCLRSKDAADYNAMSYEERLYLRKSTKKDKLCAIDFSKFLLKLRTPNVYRFSSADVIFSLEGKLRFAHYDKDNCPYDMNVTLGHSDDERAHAWIMIGEKCDCNGNDTRDIRHLEFFAARLAIKITDDHEIIANYYFHDASNHLSCNVADEVPDADASDMVFKLLANFIYKSSIDMLK